VANPLKHIVVSSSLNWLEAKREETIIWVIIFLLIIIIGSYVQS
jgi:hypothetical protein